MFYYFQALLYLAPLSLDIASNHLTFVRQFRGRKTVVYDVEFASKDLSKAVRAKYGTFWRKRNIHRALRRAKRPERNREPRHEARARSFDRVAEKTSARCRQRLPTTEERQGRQERRRRQKQSLRLERATRQTLRPPLPRQTEAHRSRLLADETMCNKQRLTCSHHCSVIVTTRPPPSRFCAVTVPPQASMQRLVMARPSPLPPVLRPRAASGR